MGTDSREEQLGIESGWQDDWLGDLGQVFKVVNLSYHFIDGKTWPTETQRLSLGHMAV